MKRKNTLWSLVLALVMVLGVFAPLSALADTTKVPAPAVPTGTIKATDLSKEKPESTTLHIYKLQADSYNFGKEGLKHSGGKIETNDQGEYPKTFGNNVKGLAGVEFTYYKLKDEAAYKTIKKDTSKYDTVEKMTQNGGSLIDGQATKIGPTNEKGEVSVSGLEEGYYWFVESKKPENVSSAIAVPFGISLPLTNPVDVKDDTGKTHDAGTVYLKNVHVYPKNVTGDLPKTEKDVNEIGNKTANFKIGDPVSWFITGDIPANLKEYKRYYLTDNLDNQLSYTGKPKVLYGTYADKAALIAEKNKIDGTNQKTGILPESYYTLTEPTANSKGGTLKLELTEAGRKALYSESDPKHKLYFYFETKINEDAIMGKDIENNVILKFINTPDGDKEKESKPEKPPHVNTGGKRFIKLDEKDKSTEDLTNATKLEDAVFTIKHQENGDEPKNDAWKNVQDLTWTEDLIKANKAAIDAGKFATKDETKDVYTKTSTQNQPTKGSVIYLRSDGQGAFEIKGLKYSKFTPEKWDSAEQKLVPNGTEIHNYYALKEVKAPKEYGLIDGYTPFTIDANSYYENPTAQVLADAKPDRILNKNLTIPQTGGMGTMIFMVAGLALMGGAFIAMRKRSAEQA